MAAAESVAFARGDRIRLHHGCRVDPGRGDDCQSPARPAIEYRILSWYLARQM